jgi:hypothetical protein
VAYSATTALYALAAPPKSLVIYMGAAHGTALLNTADCDDLVRRLLAFVAQAMP